MASDGEKTGVVPANYIRILGKRKGKLKMAADSDILTTSPSPAAPADVSLGFTDTNNESSTKTSLGSSE